MTGYLLQEEEEVAAAETVMWVKPLVRPDLLVAD
jgi:hypothetical protein